MLQRSSSSLYTFLRRHPFRHSPNPNPPSLFPKSFTTIIPPHPASQFHHPILSTPHSRTFSSRDSAPEFDTNRVVDEINLKFAEAREEIESAMDSKETVYFNEEAECARVAVQDVLDMFEGLLAKLQEKERDAVRRSMGLKIEQLKAELQQLDE